MPASTSRAQAARAAGVELARMVGVQRHIGRLALAFSAATSAGVIRAGSTTGTRVWKRITFTWSIAPSRRHESAQAARRQDQRIAAGDDHLPDLGPARDIGERGLKRVGGERAEPLRPDHLAAEAEAAIDRADVDELQQHAVGIAVDDALDRDCAPRRRSDRRALPAARSSSRASGTNWRAIGSSRVAPDRSARPSAGVMATA